VPRAPMIHVLSELTDFRRDQALSYSTLLLYNDTGKPQIEQVCS